MQRDARGTADETRLSHEAGSIPLPPEAFSPFFLANAAADLISVRGRDGRLLFANPAYRTLFPGGDPCDGDVFSDIHPDDRAPLRAILQSESWEPTGRRLEHRLLLSDGTVRQVETQCNAIQPGSGSSAILLISRDITERVNVEQALRSREIQLQEAHEIAKLGSWEWNLQSNTRTWSKELLAMFGMPREASLEEFRAVLHPDDQPRYMELIQRALRTGELYENHYRVIRPDGSTRVIHSHARIERDAAGSPVRMLGVCRDVTDARSIEELARASQERFRLLVENVRDYALYLLDAEGFVTSWNSGAERIKGYQVDEIVGRHFSCFFPPYQREIGKPADQIEVAAREGRFEGEDWRVRKDGSTFWAHVVLTPLRDEEGRLRGFSNITHDVTKRRRAEDDLRSYAQRIQSMSRRLVHTQESERRLLAQELHDRVGQNLTALGLNVRLIANAMSPESMEQCGGRIEECVGLLEATVDAIRNVMGELRPQVLDEYGLVAALRSHAAAFSRRTGIAVSIAGDEACEFPKSADLAIFRIAQEALNNVVKHAQASRVELAFSAQDGVVRLVIQDDGAGFSAKPADNADPGWGILIMRERAETVGARLTVESNPGQGVRLQVEYRM
jgi:PAS domain S-box-containing protein